MLRDRRTHYQKIRAKGLCGSCASRKAEPGLARCAPCMEQTRATRNTLAAAGLCVCCKKPTNCKRTTCDGCADFERKRQTLTRKMRKTAGLCSQCGEHPRNGKAVCAKCAKAMSKRSEAHRKRNKAQGLCIKCGKLALSGLTLCMVCREKRLSYFRTHKRDQRAEHKARRDVRRAAGLCPKCGKGSPVPGRKHCDDCMKANTISCQLRKLKKQQAAEAQRQRQGI